MAITLFVTGVCVDESGCHDNANTVVTGSSADVFPSGNRYSPLLVYCLGEMETRYFWNTYSGKGAKCQHFDSCSACSWVPYRPVFLYKLRYIAGFGLVEMAISTNPKPAIYRNLHENTDPGNDRSWPIVIRRGIASGRTR